MSTLNVDTLQDKAGAFEHARLVQVQTVSKTDIFTSTNTSFVDVTGLTVDITPTVAANKILVMFQLWSGADDRCQVKLLRDSTAINLGDASSSRISCSGVGMSGGEKAYQLRYVGGTFIDSPNSTSALTYKLQVRANSGTAAVNATQENSDSAVSTLTASNIVLMEIRT